MAPRIEKGEEFDEDHEVKDAETLYDHLRRGAFSGIDVGLVHGRMDSIEKQSVMEKFVSGETRLLVSTSVIEVGVDVPAATVMVIEGADLFGLAQLHQLRGRVGRGGGKSYCFLLSPAAGSDSEVRGRLLAFCRLNDGFKIAEMDLRSRGPGEMAGIRQSGWGNQVMADILDAPDLFREVQEEICQLTGSQ